MHQLFRTGSGCYIEALHRRCARQPTTGSQKFLSRPFEAQGRISRWPEVSDTVHVLFLCVNQLLQVFKKHKELIRRPTISKELQSERETLLARLLDYSKGLQHYTLCICSFSFPLGLLCLYVIFRAFLLYCPAFYKLFSKSVNSRWLETCTNLPLIV